MEIERICSVNAFSLDYKGMMELNVLELKRKYVHDLETNFLPFWEKFMDDSYGGVFTCITNTGDEVISERKYIWSQGRFLWLGCKLIELKKEGILSLSEPWENRMHQTYTFLRNHALMPNRHVVFAVERDGEKIKDEMDKSIFADCFYVLGCNAYARFQQDTDIFEHCLEMYETIKDRVRKNDIPADPYPVPQGFRSHSIPMILLNVANELYETAVQLKVYVEAEILGDIETFLSDIFRLKDGDRIREMYAGDDPDTLLERHVNPGHMIECAWFMLDSFLHLEGRGSNKHINGIERMVNYALTRGWDEEYGGLLRFVDKDGGKPQGECIGTPYESLIMDTWDTKLWWPHSEALYTTLLLYRLTGKEEWLSQYEKIETYTFHTFPNENKTIGEWIQIRDRKGKPLNQVVALPVKDPFHIIRTYIKIICLIEGSD